MIFLLPSIKRTPVCGVVHSCQKHGTRIEYENSFHVIRAAIENENGKECYDGDGVARVYQVDDKILSTATAEKKNWNAKIKYSNESFVNIRHQI